MMKKEGIAKMVGKRSFALIEIIIVIIILGIAAGVAIPRFLSLPVEAYNAAEQNVLKGLRVGIEKWHAKEEEDIYPPALDDAIDGTFCVEMNECFEVVLGEDAVTGGGWSKINNTTYQHSQKPTNTSTYTYNPANGLFVCTSNCP